MNFGFEDHLDLSIVVPTYNAKESAHRAADSLQAYLSKLGLDFEIVLVDDGSRPDERPEEQQLPPGARLVQLDRNRGKGAAVRAGFTAASGRCRIFTDVDLPYGLECVAACYRAIVDEGTDFVYGDRSLAASRVVARPSWRRRLSSAVFRRAVSGIVGLPSADTQCGLKGFSGSVADDLVRIQRTDRFAFDVEIFRCVRDNGWTTAAIPVELVNEDVSTVRLLHDSMTMMKDLLMIRERAGRGEYRLAQPILANGISRKQLATR